MELTLTVKPEEVEEHQHPSSKEKIVGKRLKPGEKIPKGALYSSFRTNNWEDGDHMIGSTVGENARTIWVIPAVKGKANHGIILLE